MRLARRVAAGLFVSEMLVSRSSRRVFVGLLGSSAKLNLGGASDIQPRSVW